MQPSAVKAGRLEVCIPYVRWQQHRSQRQRASERVTGCAEICEETCKPPADRYLTDTRANAPQPDRNGQLGGRVALGGTIKSGHYGAAGRRERRLSWKGGAAVSAVAP
ncbi:Hypothetical predicted protein [Cloeon dipterum]|uniref:Uncharacterized protein n=1 Tax=Cloeon dipterum TaxID=197152 RepID=A0A8S1C1X4_9INSE|nr:Hypothetical predicted protein [Cloeon dipterum]